MKKPNIKISKEKLTDFATSVSTATKNAVNSVSTTVKDSSEQISEQIDKARFESDRKKLCPVFEEDILSPDFQLPVMIRLVDYDKRMENKACEGAVGFETNTKTVRILNIYTEYSHLLGLTFYPHVKESVFYVDPCHNNFYICLDDYFGYLKKVRVDELETIAQDLGAKHVKITLKEQKQSFSTESKKSSLNVARIKAGISHDSSNNSLSNIEVAAEVDFAGKETPVEPTLVYFKNESDIKALVKMRLDPNNQNKILSKTYSFQYNNSSGIKVKDAAEISEALSKLKLGTSASIVNEATCESRTILEYSIVF